MEFRNADATVTYAEQLHTSHDGPVVLMNQFNVDAADVDTFLAAWREDAEFLSQQPGFISTQMHRGIGGSTTFVNRAVWATPSALATATQSPQFRAGMSRYPSSAVATPHLYETLEREA